MKTKRFLVLVNKWLTMLTGSLVFLLISVPIFTRKNKRRIRIPLAVNVIVLTIILLIIAAYGGAFDKRKQSTAALNDITFQSIFPRQL